MTTNVNMFGWLAIFLTLNSVEAQQWQIRNNSLERVQARDSSESKSHLFRYDSQNWYAFSCKSPPESTFLWSVLGFGSIGEYHTILLVDRRGKRLRSGTTISEYGYVPLTFVQMKSGGKFLPEDYKDKWIYAVVVFSDRSQIAKNEAIKIIPEGQQGGDDKTSALVIPIRWNEDAEKFKIGLGLLQDSVDLKIREIK